MPRTIVIRIVVDNRDAVNAAKVQTESLKQLQMQTASVNDEMRKNELHSLKMADAQKEAGKSHDNLVASFVKGFIAARALSEAYSLVTSSVGFLSKSVVDLELNFAKVQAVTGESKEQVNSLKDVVFNLGRTTASSTVEISAAALELAKLGFEGKNLEIALAGVARLSSVLGDSLETTGNLVGAVIQTFDLSAEEAAKVADKLFIATGKSATNIEGFRTSFNYAGAAAQIADVSFDELATVLALLSNNGIRASTAGTGLRSVFTALATDGSKAQVALGGSIEGMGLLGVMKKLGELKLDPGSIVDLFGKPALPVVLNLTKMSDAFEKLYPQVKNANGELEKSGKIIEETLSGSFQKLSNSIVELVNALTSGPGHVLVDIFSGIAKDINSISDGLKNVNDLLAIMDRLNSGSFLGLDASKIANGGISGPSFDQIKDQLQKIREAKAMEPGAAQERLDAVTGATYDSYKNKTDASAAAIAEAKAAAQKKAYDEMAKSIRKNYDEIKDLVDIQDHYNVSLDKSEINNYVDQLQKMAITLQGIGRNKETVDILKTIADLKDRIREPFQQDELAIIPDQTAFPPSFEQSVKNLSQGKDENRSKSQAEFDDYIKQVSESTDNFNQRIGITKSLLEGVTDASDMMASRLADNLVNLDNPFKHFGDTVKQIAKQFIADFIAMELRILALKAVIKLAGFFFGPEASVGVGGILAPVGVPGLGDIQAAASGYDGVVNSPRLFLAGENGSERVRVTPLSKSGAGGSSEGGMTIIVQGDVYNSEKLVDKIAMTNERSKTRYV